MLVVSAKFGVGQVQHQISAGYGLNNIRYDNRFPVVELSTYFNSTLNYHILFAKNFEARLGYSYIDYNQKFKVSNGRKTNSSWKRNTISVGLMYHFYKNRKLDFSSGYNLGYEWINVVQDGFVIDELQYEL